MIVPIVIHAGAEVAVFPGDDRILLGEGLFETLRVVEGKPCYPRHHWFRLMQSADMLGIDVDLPYCEWVIHLEHSLRKANLETGGVKVLLGAGSAPRGMLTKGEQPRLVLTPFSCAVNTKPIRLISAPWLRDAANPVYRHKSVNYLEAIMARRYAETAGADDALFFNRENTAMETTIANLFLISGDTLYTPSLSSGVLPGIIRGRILELGKEQGIACLETELTKNQLEQADALFLCNALQGIRAVQSWDGFTYNTSHPLAATVTELLSKDTCHERNSR
ncbi:aminotransferase class IV [Legionella spiritensis]|uniref:aminotransferase class IV n=1 Tax=Legionella spiritensis TaxID=452 RepID=UPI000F6DBCE3|nr:aminotransferase class IV [Legionella spiritensis]VEG90802.1 aminodeoxychorismate lyase [Legionella spiritensis]